ncbi:MAG: HD domain-containing protein [Verrucomicrobia bacterium]|jgi:GTP pyrophosphokinase|nr:HD domain-containing protein [Verrucomicrobiota bacterium]
MKLTQRFEDTLLYAARAHATQVRKGTDIPYLAHLLAVTAIALEHGATEAEAIAALLHDAVEDSGGPERQADIEARFGGEVAAIVAGCTDTDQTPKPPWTQRKQAYVAHVRTAPESVQLVSAADKLHNAQSILHDYEVMGDALWGRFSGGKAGTLWYYRALADGFSSNRVKPLARKLNDVVQRLERAANAGEPVTEPPEITS